ncbi:MAG TPA: CoA pyrophosphatase [Acidimicrobiia bacterium]|nr:CoA pyrophosphatase [Acidimicrobiia bacterium]
MVESARPRGGAQRIPRPIDHEIGGPSPWASLSADRLRLSLVEVRARCAALPEPADRAYRTAASRDAAVLVPVFESQGEARVVLTKRPETMPSHRGEIAFPGGTVQPGVDATPEAAARREAYEEVGLVPAAVDVVAALDPLGTVGSQFVIHPFVGVIDQPPRLRRDPREVDRVFDVALAELLDPAHYREERWTVPSGGGLPSHELVVSFFELEGETVWGATARILRGLLSRLVGVEEGSGFTGGAG